MYYAIALILGLLTGFGSTSYYISALQEPTLGALPVIGSAQLAASPSANLVLKTDGTANFWGTDNTGGGGGGSFPFSADTNYGQVVYSTSTPTIWLKSGVFASSTSRFVYASTTALSAASLCLNGDTCRTTWPTSGSNAFEVATTSDIAISQLGYISKTGGRTTLASVATTTLTATAPLSLSQPVVKVGGSNSTLTLDTSGTWSGNAGTASALAADPSDCSAGSFPLGINAAGTAQSCTDAWTEAENTAAAYAPQSRQLTVAGTANQITSSAGAQTLAADRTWTLSLPSTVIFPIAFNATYGTTTFASSTVLTATRLFATNATTTSLGVLDLTAVNCDVKATTGGSLYCGTDSTGVGGGSYPFVPTAWNGFTTSATTSKLFAMTGLMASSTSYFDSIVSPYSTTTFASTTSQTITNQWFTGLTNSGLGVNSAGKVYAAATTTYSTGLTYANGAVTLNATGDWTGTIDGNNFGGGAIGQGDLLYGSAAGTISELAKDTNATRYLSNTGASNNPAWAQVDLTNGVTGDLPFSSLAQVSANSVLANNTAATADAQAVSTSTLFGAGITPGYVLAFSNGIWTPMATATCVQITGSVDLCDGSDASGTGVSFPFTAQPWGNSTSTTIGFTQGLISNASSTFTSTLFLSSLTNSGLAVNGSGQVYAAATTTFAAPLTYSNGQVSLAQANGSTNGYLSSTDWTLFNNKVSSSSLVSSLTAAFPFTQTTNYGANTNATSTTIWFQNGLTASTTARFESLTAGYATTTFASTTVLSANTLCLSTDCRTTWPSGGSAVFPFTQTTFGSTNANATSTLIGFTQGIYSLASSTIGGGTATTGLTVSGTATTTNNLAVFNNITMGHGVGNAPHIYLNTARDAYIDYGTGSFDILSIVNGSINLSLNDGTGVISSSNAIDFGDSTSFELPNNSNPTTDAAGEIAIDTTTGQLRWYDGTKSHVALDEYQISTFLASSTLSYFGATTTINIANPRYAATTTSIYCKVPNGTSYGLRIGDGTASTTYMTCTSSGTELTSYPNGAFSARENVMLDVGTPIGSPSGVTVTITQAKIAD